MYRSQLLLQQLGISQWIPKHTETSPQSKAILWRDQDEPPIIDSTSGSVSAAVLQIKQNNTKPIVLAEKAALQKAEAQHTASVDIISQQQIIQGAVGLDDDMGLATEAPKTIAFNWHVLVHENFMLFAEIMTEQQQKLFNRIAQACHVSEHCLLQWPLAIEFWEINDHVLNAYLNGVFAAHQHKVCILLGQLDVVNLKPYFKQQIVCANLEQLLESAQQKRALWQQLYPLVYDVENQNAQEGRDI